VSTVAYVSQAESGSVAVLALDEATGALRLLQQPHLGGQIMPLALAPDGRFLYAARRSAPLAALSLAIDRSDGSLTLQSETPLPASMPSLALDARGRWLLSASYHDGLVAVNGIDADGQVQPTHQVLATGAKTHRLIATPDNRHALACVLGEDQLLRFSFDAHRGRLGAPEQLAMPQGSGPRHLALHPQGHRAWVLGELDGSVTTVGLGPDGLRVIDVVSAMPPGFVGTPWAADLHRHPAGGFLVASERASSTLCLLAIDATQDRLQPRGHWPTQAQPRGFAISPSGRWLLCAGQRSHAVGVHRIDLEAGTLEPVHELPVGGEPNWIELLDLP
jgi:6-phosphogluconolactonase